MPLTGDRRHATAPQHAPLPPQNSRTLLVPSYPITTTQASKGTSKKDHPKPLKSQTDDLNEEVKVELGAKPSRRSSNESIYEKSDYTLLRPRSQVKSDRRSFSCESHQTTITHQLNDPLKEPSSRLAQLSNWGDGHEQFRQDSRFQNRSGHDHVRSRAETDFYEHEDSRGTVRRRSIMRAISRDDYLTARGANPRTGMVTPGYHSASNSFDDNARAGRRNISAPGKWRQREDQWVFGKPTPLASPMRELRIPPKLSSRPLVGIAELQMPGGLPLSPDDKIKRKPVASPSSRSDHDHFLGPKHKELVCQQTNSGQYRLQQRAQDIVAPQGEWSPVLPIPDYHTLPSAASLPRTRRHPMIAMDERHAFVDDDVYTQQYNTISTNTSTRMCTPHRMDRYPKERLGNQLRMMGPEQSNLLPRVRPREMSRPRMPVRADGLHIVPRLQQGQSLHGRMYPSHLPASTVPNMTPHEATQGDAIALCLRNGSDYASQDILQPRMMTPKYSGLIRRCSHCHHISTSSQQLSTDGAIHTSASPTKVASEHGYRSNPANMPNEADSSASDVVGRNENPSTELSDVGSNNCSDRAVSLKQLKLTRRDPLDERDHSICCPECCLEQDCHEGCLGHPSPRANPDKSKLTNWDLHATCNNAADGSVTDAGISDTESPQSSPGRSSKLVALRLALKKNFGSFERSGKHSNISVGTPTPGSEVSTAKSARESGVSEDMATVAHSKGAAAAAKRALENRIEDSSHANGAINAARRALGLTESEQPGSLRVRKVRSTSLTSAAPSGTSEASDASSGQASSKEIRDAPKGGSASSLVVPGNATVSKSRNVSGASVEIPIPGTISIAALWDLAYVPVEASRMWLRNHPDVMDIGWWLLERIHAMTQLMARTSFKIWGMVFIYSKTGKIKLTRGETAAGFVLDCSRSFLYLLLFVGLTVFGLRVLRLVWGIFRVIGLGFTGVGWLLGHLLL